jgi:hypothetical protein
MSNPNYYDLSGKSTRITWYPQGKGGPIVAGGPSASTPVLFYSNGSQDVCAYGNDLKVSKSPAGTFVTAVVKKGNILPGAFGDTCFTALIPDADVESNHSVPIHSVGVVSVHRGAALSVPGQLETYTTIQLTGTAAILIRPD